MISKPILDLSTQQSTNVSDLSKSKIDPRIDLSTLIFSPTHMTLPTEMGASETPNKSTIQKSIKNSLNESSKHIPQIKVNLMEITNNFQTPILQKQINVNSTQKVSSPVMTGKLDFSA